MLTELKVSQFAIIDSIHISFNSGLNILSGETGAGKSILIKSLGLLMGAKSSVQDIRSNKEKALIEGAFDLSQREDIIEKLGEIGIEIEDESLIVRRVLQKNGKTKVYLNGQLSTVSDLRRIVFPLVTMSDPTDAPLVEITGQHENKDLMSLRYQMDVLDQYCGNLDLRQNLQSAWESWKEITEKIEELESRSMQREQQIDFLEFQIKEIESLELIANEDEELLRKIKRMRQSGKWQKWIQDGLHAISNDERSMTFTLSYLLKHAPDDESLSRPIEQMEQARVLLEDSAYELQRLSDRFSDPDESLDDMEDRLNRIRKLQKKFGDSVEDIMNSLESMKREHHDLSNLSETLQGLQQEKNEIYNKILELSEKLNKKRSSGAKLLTKEVNVELNDLNMKGLTFQIDVESLEEPNSTGMDRVVFRTKAAAKDAARDLSRAASGGELSRILLSLKQVTGSQQHPRTFLFDEVDTGVSGPTAEKVGAKLKNLAQYQQVICVTHLPQVASFGDHHFYIEKEPGKGTVKMSVRRLSPSDRVEEIARLISGEKVTKTSRAHAKQLLEQASL